MNGQNVFDLPINQRSPFTKAEITFKRASPLRQVFPIKTLITTDARAWDNFPILFRQIFKVSLSRNQFQFLRAISPVIVRKNLVFDNKVLESFSFEPLNRKDLRREHRYVVVCFS